MNIVSSLPMRSETQRKNRRVIPFRMRSSDSAKVSAGSVSPAMETGTLALFVVVRDRGELSSGHETARGDRHEHRVHHPEHRSPDFARPESRADCATNADFATSPSRAGA